MCGADGRALITAAAKVATLPDIRDEAERYGKYILRLSPGGFPQLSGHINCGAGKYGGLFYGLVGDVETLFQKLANPGNFLATVPARVQEIEAPWYDASQLDKVLVGQIRRNVIPDTQLPGLMRRLEKIDINKAEARRVRVARCTQHGDLHCANVVFDQSGRAMVIDFGDAGPAFAALDAVTLELSTVFHLQAQNLADGWPTEEAMHNWIDVERFVQGCAFAPFIRECRRLALSVAGSPEEVVAVAYAYALRQLKYEDTNKELARALIRTCVHHLDE